MQCQTFKSAKSKQRTNGDITPTIFSWPYVRMPNVLILILEQDVKDDKKENGTHKSHKPKCGHQSLFSARDKRFDLWVCVHKDIIASFSVTRNQSHACYSVDLKLFVEFYTNKFCLVDQMFAISLIHLANGCEYLARFDSSMILMFWFDLIFFSFRPWLRIETIHFNYSIS